MQDFSWVKDMGKLGADSKEYSLDVPDGSQTPVDENSSSQKISLNSEYCIKELSEVTSQEEESGDLRKLQDSQINLDGELDGTKYPSLIDSKGLGQPEIDENKIKTKTGENFNPIKEVSDEGESSKMSHQSSINRNSDQDL